MKLTRNQIIGLVIVAVVLLILFIWKPWKTKNGTGTRTAVTDTGTKVDTGTGRFSVTTNADNSDLIDQIVSKSQANQRVSQEHVSKVRNGLSRLSRHQLNMIINNPDPQQTKPCWGETGCTCYEWLFNTSKCLNL